MKPEKLIISQQSRWKAIFDTTIIAVIAYSCFTTVYYVAFDATQSESAKNKDLVVTVFFSFDFFFNMAQEYQDKETFVRIRDHKKIIAKYASSGQMLLDFVATFPFNLFFGDELIFTKLARLTRLSKLVAIFDISRMKRIIKSYYENSNRSDRLQSQYIVMYAFRIFRLVVIATLITYMIGCAWWGFSLITNNEM